MGWFRAVAVGLIGLLFASCSAPAASRQGSALSAPYTGQILKIREGQEFSYDEVYLRNESHDPITLKSVELLSDPSLGGHIDTLRTVIAPLHANRDTTPGGVWLTFPPTLRVFPSGPCMVQHVEPVEGYVLPPGGDARVILLMKAVRPGPYRVAGDRVTYGQGGGLREQVLDYEFEGTVTTGPTDLELLDIERACASSAMSCLTEDD